MRTGALSCGNATGRTQFIRFRGPAEGHPSGQPQTGGERVRRLPVRGKIRNLRTGRETLFRRWLEDGSDSMVPVRIEFQARSFLRLTFEALPA
jgi:hypothetical protein